PVSALRSNVVLPGAIVGRADRPHQIPLKQQLALICDVDAQAVIADPDSPNAYQVPLDLQREGLDRQIVKHLQLPDVEPDLADWQNLVDRMASPIGTVRIALVGKYIDLSDGYLS